MLLAYYVLIILFIVIAYDELIQSIDKDKTKVIKENDEITDIYITVNGEEYHFEFKEEK